MRVFVVSPPRTGTVSICKMADMCGYRSKHAPIWTIKNHRSRIFNFYADTPCYEPEHIKGWVDESPEYKFIYIDKPPEELIDSWIKVGLINNYENFQSAPTEQLNPGQKYDKEIYTKAFTNKLSTETAVDIFMNHRDTIISIIPSNRLLIYKFDDGWDPFCDFLHVKVPKTSIPRLNINTMFD